MSDVPFRRHRLITPGYHRERPRYRPSTLVPSSRRSDAAPPLTTTTPSDKWPGLFGRTTPTTRIRSRTTPSSSSRSEEHTSELQSLMRTSYAGFCLKKKYPTTNASHNDNPETRHHNKEVARN